MPPGAWPLLMATAGASSTFSEEEPALRLRRGPHNDLAYVHIGGLLDRKYDRAGDCIRCHRELVSRGGQLRFYFRVGHIVCEVGPCEAGRYDRYAQLLFFHFLPQ